MSGFGSGFGDQGGGGFPAVPAGNGGGGFGGQPNASAGPPAYSASHPSGQGGGQQRDRTNTGVFSRNDRKQSDRHPDVTGSADILCPHCGATSPFYLDAWQKRRNSDGQPFYSVSFKYKHAPRGQQGQGYGQGQGHQQGHQQGPAPGAWGGPPPPQQHRPGPPPQQAGGNFGAAPPPPPAQGQNREPGGGGHWLNDDIPFGAPVL